MSEKYFCARISEERPDPFVGLATHAELWLLVEYTLPWESIAVYHNQLPEQVKTWLKALANSYMTTHAMVLFIRKSVQPVEGVRCFVGVTRTDREALYAFQFDTYEDLLTLDLDALRMGAPAYDSYLSSQSLYLVCTNGKHDMCCAKFGMPIYREASRLASEQTWHCTHMGGDQFAANMLCLPHGVCYSRVTTPEVTNIIEADQRASIYLEKCRGRTRYTNIVQAADHYLRVQTGITALDAFQLLDTTTDAGGNEIVRFSSASDQKIHCLTIRCETCELAATPCPCKNPSKNQRQEFQLLAYQCIQQEQERELNSFAVQRCDEVA